MVAKWKLFGEIRQSLDMQDGVSKPKAPYGMEQGWGVRREGPGWGLPLVLLTQVSNCQWAVLLLYDLFWRPLVLRYDGGLN